MAQIHVSTETYALLLQAKDFLVEARRLKPGPARNDLREVAKVLREIAKDDAQFASGFDRQEGPDQVLRSSLPADRAQADHAASPVSPSASTGSADM